MLTDRLDLRPLTDTDVDDLFLILSDPNVWKHRPDLVHTDKARTAEWVTRAAARWDTDGLSYWLIRTREDSEVLGIGGVQRQVTGNWNLHYRLATTAWGRGYASEVSRTALDAAHNADNDVAVIAWIDPVNEASIRVAERVGLIYRGSFADPSDGIIRRAYTDRPTENL